jgi:hypothetical protein
VLLFEPVMPSFHKTPVILLTKPPGFIEASVRARLLLPGTYNIFDEKEYVLRVPKGNDAWKGRQNRLIAVQYADNEIGSQGPSPPLQWLDDDEHLLDIKLVSEQPIAPRLWAYLIAPRDTLSWEGLSDKGVMYKTNLILRDTKPLPVELTREEASGDLPFWGGVGGPDAARHAIIDEYDRQTDVELNTQIAYILATARHETALTWSPVREGVRDDAEGSRRGLWYYPYYGRGYVQLTHKNHYDFYGKKFSVNMVADPDLALQPNLALFILIHGMMTGAFGIPLPRFVNAQSTDFLRARQSVNGMDVAQMIADSASAILRSL